MTFCSFRPIKINKEDFSIPILTPYRELQELSTDVTTSP